MADMQALKYQVNSAIDLDDVTHLKSILENFPELKFSEEDYFRATHQRSWKVMEYFNSPPDFGDVIDYTRDDFIKLFKLFHYDADLELIKLISYTKYPDVRDYLFETLAKPEDIWEHITNPAIAVEIYEKHSVPISKENLNKLLIDQIQNLRNNDTKKLRKVVDLFVHFYGTNFVKEFFTSNLHMFYHIEGIDAINYILDNVKPIDKSFIKDIKREYIIYSLKKGNHQRINEYLKMLNDHFEIKITVEEIIHD